MPDGLIPSLSAFVDSSKKTIRQKLADLLSNPLPYLQQTAGQVNEDAKVFNRQSLAAALGNPVAKEQMRSSMLDTAMNFAPAMTVWHGSPHKFSRFDMSKVGTGEGAQAYGHGLYMAESPAVANEYRQRLSMNAGEFKPTFFYDNAPIEPSRAIRAISSYMDNSRSPEKAKQIAASMNPDIAEEIAKIDASKLRHENSSGYTYKSDIPDEAVARFLDWDKPLSQQATEVQSALRRAGVDPEKHFGTGGGLISELNGSGGIPDMPWMGQGEKFLSNNGVPGIRYLDGGSRSAGQGSSNFVLFDDRLPRILEINGTPTGQQPWKPGEWK